MGLASAEWDHQQYLADQKRQAERRAKAEEEDESEAERMSR